MIFCGIGTGDDDHISGFNIGDGIGHCTTAECRGQTGHSRAMSEPSAMIDIVGLQHRPGKFMGDVVLLIGDSR